jgi:hypothetical protein
VTGGSLQIVFRFEAKKDSGDTRSVSQDIHAQKQKINFSGTFSLFLASIFRFDTK